MHAFGFICSFQRESIIRHVLRETHTQGHLYFGCSASEFENTAQVIWMAAPSLVCANQNREERSLLHAAYAAAENKTPTRKKKQHKLRAWGINTQCSNANDAPAAEKCASVSVSVCASSLYSGACTRFQVRHTFGVRFINEMHLSGSHRRG